MKKILSFYFYLFIFISFLTAQPKPYVLLISFDGFRKKTLLLCHSGFHRFLMKYWNLLDSLGAGIEKTQNDMTK